MHTSIQAQNLARTPRIALEAYLRTNMVNNYDKMRRSQAKAKAFLYKELGVDLVWTIQHTRFSNDIFGLWDGLFIKHEKVRFYQVKSNSKPKLQPFKEFWDKYHIPFLILICYDGGEIKVVSNLAFCQV